MTTPPIEETVGLAPEFVRAFQRRGYASLTPVQRAVLDPALHGHDLRISSQTGSGKTIAIGLAMRTMLEPEVPPAYPSRALPDLDDDESGVLPESREDEPDDEAELEASSEDDATEESAPADPTAPRGLVIAPTRELAKQVEEELSWLYEPLGAKVVSLVGGTSVRDERRALQQNPTIIVGTPGRLLDHQRRGTLRTHGIHSVVLDEADRMLDMGFRDDIEALFAAMPGRKHTHLVSATFPREVRALAAKIQKDFVSVEGTPLGQANADIQHVIHLCHATERLNAIINLMLEGPLDENAASSQDATLIFVRTRADVSGLTRELQKAGFRVAGLSGEMEQAARNRALDAFKTGALDALVATDVAARGIDSQNVVRVIHADPPSDADTYTHRSGRTGRAGRKGRSLLLVAPAGYDRVLNLLRRAKVTPDLLPLPSREQLLEAENERWFTELTVEFTELVPDDRIWALAKRIVRDGDVTRALGRLLHVAQTRGRAQPRELAPVQPPRGRDRFSREPREPRGHERERDRSAFEAPNAPGRFPRREQAPSHAPGDWVSFQVSWGELHGADPRRLVAMACRRGQIAGGDIGAIRVGRSSSFIEVAASVASDFERAVAAPDPRDPRINFRRGEAAAGARGQLVRDDGAGRIERRAPRPPQADEGGFGDKPRAPREGGFGDKPRAPREGGFGDKPRAPRDGGFGDRPRAPREGGFGDKPRAPREGGFGDRPYAPREGGFGDKPRAPREGGFADRPRAPREGGFGDRPRAPREGGFGDKPRAQGDAPPRKKPRKG